MNIVRWTLNIGFIGLLVACNPDNEHLDDGHWLDSQNPEIKEILKNEDEIVTITPDLVSKYGDVLFATGRSEYLNDPKLFEVTTEFGFTVIDMTKLPYRSDMGDSDIRPWSSWWFPKFEDTLFKGTSMAPASALTKYDYYRKKIKEQPVGSAADSEASQHNPNLPRWEGLCNAWALASILHKEPRHTVSYKRGSLSNGVTFSVGEMKGLLLKSYEAVEDKDLTYYGQKFTGDADSWIFPDPFADQFHRFIEIQLFQKKQPFIMDHDPGVQVWNEPVFKANYTIQAVEDNPQAVMVRMWLYSSMPNSKNEIDNVGGKDNVREYHYILMGDRDANNMLTIRSGIWIRGANGVDSRRDHPDYFITIPHPQNIHRMSFNKEIIAETVDEILKNAY